MFTYDDEITSVCVESYLFLFIRASFFIGEINEDFLS